MNGCKEKGGKSLKSQGRFIPRNSVEQGEGGRRTREEPTTLPGAAKTAKKKG